MFLVIKPQSVRRNLLNELKQKIKCRIEIY